MADQSFGELNILYAFKCMCSFIFSRTKIRPEQQAIEIANHFSKFRGPDKTTVRCFKDTFQRELLFLHNLLDISGNACEQPIVDDREDNLVVALFNGEIYNYKNLSLAASDTECLIPQYKARGSSFAKELDGEFSIILYDFKSNQLSILADPFLTKPLFIGRSENPEEFGAATCASSLRALGFTHVEMVEPNSCYTVKFAPDGFTMEKNHPVHQFDLTQTKETYDDWCQAFLNAVKKRALHGAHPPVVFLSSGFDSGAICQALNLLNIPYETFSIMAGEAEAVLRERIKINLSHSCRKGHQIEGISPERASAVSRDIAANVEPFSYVHEDAPGMAVDLRTDSGSLGAYCIAEAARKINKKVNLSGSGADEIVSDYGHNGRKFYYHSQFGGRFPDDLSSIFPWKKFYGDTQRSYLFKDEYILGCHGIEGRYPFLDKAVVQEFLSLKPELKNRAYKAPIAHFLKLNNYPYEPSVKRGFSPHLPGRPSPLEKLKRLMRAFR